MAASTPTKEPETLTSGVTWKWKKTLADYPASEWGLVYYLRRNGDTLTSYNTTADGDDHLLNVVATITTLRGAGEYDLVGIVTKGAEKFVVYQGRVEVLPNPQQSGAYDPRTHAEKVIDAIEAVLESRATKEILNFSVEGNSLSSIPHADLLALRSRYRIEVEREKAAERLKMGRGSGRRILTRFQ